MFPSTSCVLGVGDQSELDELSADVSLKIIYHLTIQFIMLADIVLTFGY